MVRRRDARPRRHRDGPPPARAGRSDVGCPGLAVRPPRPSLRRIALQPGAAACSAALLVLIVETVGQAASLASFEASKGYLGARWSAVGFASWLHTDVLLAVPYPIGFAVLASWAVLLLSQRGPPEPS